jgi:O-succinylbenzoate synthase
MKIDRVQLWRVRLAFVHTFETSSHRKSGVEHIVVAATTADGAVGWGEIASPSDPFYCAETTDTAWLIARRYLVPALLGAEGDSPEEIEALWARVRGHEFAKAGFVAAVWDAWAKEQGISLSRALDGERRTVTAGVSLGIEPTYDDLLAQDIDAVQAVRSAYPKLDLHVDANGVYPGTDEAMELLTGLDKFNLTMIEQPFAPRDFESHARLQARIDTPICLDESVVDEHDLTTMITLGAGRVLNIKASRMGGLTAAKRAHDVARGAGIPVWCGGMHEFGIGRAANIALSSLPGFTLPSDVSGSDKYYAQDVISPPVIAHDGQVTVPTAPGIGHAVEVARIIILASDSFDSAQETLI